MPTEFASRLNSKSHHDVYGWLSDTPLLILGRKRFVRRVDVGIVTGETDEKNQNDTLPHMFILLKLEFFVASTRLGLKTIDIKSLIIGFLLSAVLFLSMGLANNAIQDVRIVEIEKRIWGDWDAINTK